MSPNETDPPNPPSVPLKKETVRVTLKAADNPPSTPSAGPPVVPSAPRPPMAPSAPTAPMAPPPSATVPGGPPRPSPAAPAPTIPLRTPGAPSAGGAPSPTIRLATSTAPIGAGGGAAPTVPLRTAGAPALPRATVPLQTPSQPMTAGLSPSQMGTMRVDDDEDEGAAGETAANVLSIFAFLAACVVIFFQYKAADTWVNAEDNPRTDGWKQIISAEE